MFVETGAVMVRRFGSLVVMLAVAGVMGERALGQQQQRPQNFRGAVTNVRTNGTSFIVTDGNGINRELKTNGYTRYQLDRQDVAWDQVLKVGQQVRGNLNVDGTAALVSARSPRLSEEDEIGKVLGSTEEEWEVLKPLVVAVLEKRDEVEGLMKRVRAQDVSEPPPTNGEIRAELQQVRKQREQAAAELAQARKELVELLTLRQEYLAVEMGVLE
jgi:hypothetical protein